MENNLNKVLEMFNLSYNEEFWLEGYSETKFRFTLDGLEYYDKNFKWLSVKTNILENIILGNYVVITEWLPKKNETYYFPDIKKGEPCINVATWKNSTLDNSRYKAKMCFRTKDEALTCAEEIFEFLAKK